MQAHLCLEPDTAKVCQADPLAKTVNGPLSLQAPWGIGQSVELVVKSGAGEVLSLTLIYLHDELSPPQAIWA